MIPIESSMKPYLKSLTNCLKRLMGSGYTELFRATSTGVTLVNSSKVYGADQVRIVNSLRFEGPRTTDNKATMYVIETFDGLKGMMVETDEKRQDPEVNKFISSLRS